MSFQSEICRFGQFADTVFRQNRERISSTIKFGVGDRRPTADPLTKSPYAKIVSNLTKSGNRASISYLRRLRTGGLPVAVGGLDGNFEFIWCVSRLHH